MLIVVGLLVLVAVLFFVQNNKKNATQQSGASGGCQVQVTADVLNVRSGPNNNDTVVAKLDNGAIRAATSTVRNDFRELATNQWAANQFLKPVSGAC
jgi:uncharacterized protein YgiM (DUF1202 family)